MANSITGTPSRCDQSVSSSSPFPVFSSWETFVYLCYFGALKTKIVYSAVYSAVYGEVRQSGSVARAVGSHFGNVFPEEIQVTWLDPVFHEDGEGKTPGVSLT